MVSIPQKHILQVFLPPFVEILSIITAFPFVERLIINHESHPVTHIEEDTLWLVMAETNGIHSILLEYFKATFE